MLAGTSPVQPPKLYVFDAVADIPFMSVVAFGIKVGMTVFETRRHPASSDDLLNRNFEFISELVRQIERRRGKPVLLALDDLHQASATTYALVEYLLTRIEDARLLVVGTWRSPSPEAGWVALREALPRCAQRERCVPLRPLSEGQLRRT